MSKKFLGGTFDIHGGGQDLIFPHHENELAQSEGANERPFVHTWIHHGFVTIKDEKMSKSLGNFLTIRDITDKYHPEELRFFVFSTHYRNPLDFSEKAMQDAISGLDRLYECIAALDELPDGTDTAASIISVKDAAKLSGFEKRFTQAMDNDFNTAQSQGVLFDTVKVLNKVRRLLPSSPSSNDIELLRKTGLKFRHLAGIMGLLREDPAAYLAQKRSNMLAGLDIDEHTINDMIEKRYAARAAKDWAKSDEIRDTLLKNNIELKDNAEGTTWTVKRPS